ncbi:MAG: glycosyl hydrolase 2 galactose-binding domain-containing protein [Parvicellaceae bacterium]
MLRNGSLFFLLFFSFTISFSQQSVLRKKLHHNWTLNEKGNHKKYLATVPGTVHTDLLKNGVIEDPFYRLNEGKVQWIDKKDWVYQSIFEISENEFAKHHHEIKFEGLDTYASVILNDSLLLKSDNMHRTYIIDVKPYLKNGKNHLKIILESPIKKGLELYNNLNYKIPVSANDQAEVGEIENGKRVSVFTRKAAYHYGWDWGPRLVTSGIWRPITLESWDDFRIKKFDINYSLEDTAFISTFTEIESSIDNVYANLLVKLDDSTVINSKVHLKKGLQTVISNFKLKDPKLWWPNGMGDQYLYDCKVQLNRNNVFISSGQRLGLRTIKLAISDSKEKNNFKFIVNGVPTFTKGVNYIPQDVFLPRVKKSDYKRLLTSSAAANMNMIRVWGGGVYEDNMFYELCDSLGLMVWQDFMFACAMYPGDNSFLENVRMEAIDNFNRLKKHTCIALWCGNNENLSAWKRWGWEQTVIEEQSQKIADKIWHDYDTLFHNILPKVVHDLSLNNKNNYTMDYWASSPSASEGIPESYQSGDTHYWGVWWGKEPFENFNNKISSFMSEYGFQSFPEYESFKKFASNEDQDMYSKVMKHHQRSSIGNATIDEYMKREYSTPKDFKSLLYVSQILQADGIRTGIESHRRNKSKCMGSLYWQLNDCWPGASWSSIDYYGKWKALHYNVKRAFNQLIITHEFVDGNLQVSIVSDKLNSFEGNLEIVSRLFKGKKSNVIINRKVKLMPNEVAVVLKINKDQLQKETKNKQVFYSLRLKENENIISSKNIFFQPIKELELSFPELKHTTYYDKKEEKIIVKISAKHFAKAIHITSNSELNFSDNFFDLMPNEQKIVEIHLTKGQDPKKLMNSIELKSLWDSFN